MKAIILAAGYATRLRPLTETLAKPLLPVGGRTMVDRICDKIDEVTDVDAIHLVTNHKFAESFQRWANGRKGRLSVTVHDDGTRSNDDRLGAIGDIEFTIDQAGLSGEDLLVLAGDNLFDFSLADYVGFWRSKEDASSIALYRCPDPELVKEYAIVELDADERVTSFVEKPQHPTTDLVAIATYIYRREHAARIREYLDAGNNKDQPGNLVAWMHSRVPVYGYRFPGEWLDIGNHEQLLEADNRLRARAGLPARKEYSLES